MERADNSLAECVAVARRAKASMDAGNVMTAEHLDAIEAHANHEHVCIQPMWREYINTLVTEVRRLRAENERIEPEYRATRDLLAAILGVEPCAEGSICHANDVAKLVSELRTENAKLKEA